MTTAKGTFRIAARNLECRLFPFRGALGRTAPRPPLAPAAGGRVPRPVPETTAATRAEHSQAGGKEEKAAGVSHLPRAPSAATWRTPSSFGSGWRFVGPGVTM